MSTPIIDWNESFDTTSSLAALYLWIMFSAMFVLLNCDLQKALENNMFVKHATGILAFFFLFNVIDPNNKSHVVTTVAKTIVVYLLFIMATKSKWPYIFVSLMLLFADQIIRNHIAYIANTKTDADVSGYEKAREYLRYAIYGTIIAGYVHYYIRQSAEYGKLFSYPKFMFGVGCKNH